MSLKLLQSCFMGQLDGDLEERYHRLNFFQKVLEGKLYDELEYDFYQGVKPDGTYIPLRKRVPSVQNGLCEVILHDSTSLLFSNSHFPAISCDNKKTQIQLGDIIESEGIQELMLTAARMGAVGSVAAEVNVVDSRLVVNLLETKNLTPTYDPKNPKKLIKMEQKYKALGQDITASGVYEGLTFEDDSTYWVRAEWDEADYIQYVPWLISEDKGFTPDIFTPMSLAHNLGVVPIVWMKNLPSLCPTAIDGAPTCGVAAIRIAVELDYQMSQGGRALYYSGDPKMVIKDGDGSMGDEEESIIGGAENIIKLDSTGDAKMLEIDGKASKAVLEYCKELRERFMELSRGNRTSPDKLAAATSGYAIELMNMALTNLVKELRVAYGNNGLINLLKLIATISKKMPFLINEKPVKNIKIDGPIRLKWPDFYDETEADKQQKSVTLTTLTQGSLLSIEDAREEAQSIYSVSVQDALDDNEGRTSTFAPLVQPGFAGSGNESQPGKTNPSKSPPGKK